MKEPAMKRLLLIAVIVPSVAFAAIPDLEPEQQCLTYNNPNDGSDAVNMYAGQVAESVVHASDAPQNGITSADWLIRLAHEWQSPKCVMAHGAPRMIALLKGYNRTFKSETDWSKSAARVKAIKDQYPKEPASALLEASYWSNYAWNARGNGMANTVSPDAWKLFYERLEKAEKVLIDSKGYASVYPGWYSLSISVKKQLGRPAPEVDKIFFEAMYRFRPQQGATNIALEMMMYLLPKWGGNWDTVETMINWMTAHTREDLGTGIYSVLYENAITEEFRDVKIAFKETRVTWPRLKGSIQENIKRYPDSVSKKAELIVWSCAAEDYKTYAEARRTMRKEVFDKVEWSRNLSLEVCDIKAGLAK
jgi:hypothetical protein